MPVCGQHLAVLSAGVAAIFISAAAAAAVIAIENVNVLPMTSAVILKDRTVVVTDGRIRAICASSEHCAPGAAQRVDGRGQFLIPGLTDMHAHVDVPEFVLPSADSAMRAAAEQAMRQQLRLYVLHGVTTIRDPAGGPTNLATRGRVARGEQIGPRLFTSSIPMDGDPPLHAITKPFATPEAAAAYVRESAAAGYDFIKVYSTLAPATFDAIAASAKAAGVPFAGHVPMLVDLEHAMQSGMRSIEHLSGYDVACTPKDERVPPTMDNVYQGWAYCTKEQVTALAALTARYPVWNTPTLVVVDSLLPQYERSVEDAAAKNRFIPPALRSDAYLYSIFKPRTRAGLKGTRAVRLALVKALSDAGAPILVGTDTFASGQNVHKELRLLVEAGLTPYQALTAATSEPARYFGRVGEFGTIVPGASADLVLLDGNPLDDIANAHRIRGVMVRGDWWSRERIDAEFAAIEREFAEHP
jgi:imidazolonepropionase-like amidohydrolase